MEMRKLIEVSYEGELRTLIIEGDHRYSGAFFESIAILIAENRDGRKKWHCMHNKFHWDEGSISRFSMLFKEMLNFVEQEEEVRLTDSEVQMISEKTSIVYKMGKKVGVKNVEVRNVEYRLIYGKEQSNISIEATFNRTKLREEMNKEE
jgi:hypothetical protein